MAPSRRAVSVTRSSGTNRNSAAGSTKRWISHGQAIRSTRAFLRVTHFIAISFAGADVAPLVSGRARAVSSSAALRPRASLTAASLAFNGRWSATCVARLYYLFLRVNGLAGLKGLTSDVIMCLVCSLSTEVQHEHPGATATRRLEPPHRSHGGHGAPRSRDRLRRAASRSPGPARRVRDTAVDRAAELAPRL